MEFPVILVQADKVFSSARHPALPGEGGRVYKFVIVIHMYYYYYYSLLLIFKLFHKVHAQHNGKKTLSATITKY